MTEHMEMKRFNTKNRSRSFLKQNEQLRLGGLLA